MSFSARPPGSASSFFFPSTTGRRRRNVFLAAVVLALVWLPTMAIQRAAAVPADVAGYVDFVFAATNSTADDVTANASQNKLWYHDGIWWGAMFNQAADTFRIHKLDFATQTWTNVGPQIDADNRAKADALQTATKLYIATGDPSGPTRISRYSYSAATDTYTLDGTFPRSISTAAGHNYVSIVQDSTNRLWAAFGVANAVMISSSTDSGATWSAPFTLPSMTVAPVVGIAGSVSPNDDRVQLVKVGGSAIGVMWSRFLTPDEGFYFSVHNDADPEATWGAQETAWAGASVGDNHISAKAAADGRVIAAVKSGLNSGSSPLIAVLERSTGGAWAGPVNVSSGSQNATRPYLVLDDGANLAHVFMTSAVNGGNIHVRSASQTTLSFGSPSLGTKVIDSTAHPNINDVTSTSQRTTVASGTIALATDIPTRTYLHACVGAPCPQRPVADFTATPTSGLSPLNVQFTDTSTNMPTSWLWDFGDGSAPSTLQHPSHSYGPGTFTVTLTATNAAGGNTVTKSNFITVTEPPGAQFVPITPQRVLDSRSGAPFLHGVPRRFQVTNGGTIPTNAVAVSGNLAVTGQTRAGFVALGPDVAPVPDSSAINFPLGDDRSNGTIVPLDQTAGPTLGTLEAVFRGTPPGGSTHLVFDVTGYFVVNTAEDDFFPLAPSRVYNSQLSTKAATGVPRTFPVGGLGGVPADATAVTGNLAIFGQTAKGYAAIGPVPNPNPTTANINFPLNDVRANNVTVQLGAGGNLSFTFKGKPGSSTHFVFDVTGYFKNDSAGAEYFPLDPTRILDSRPGSGQIGATSKWVHNTPKAFDVEGTGGVPPTTPVAVTGNLTVTNQNRAGFATIGPDVPPSPSFSTLNFPVGDNRGNGATVQTNATDGTLEILFYGTPAGGSTDFVFDVSGYFR